VRRPCPRLREDLRQQGDVVAAGGLVQRQADVARVDAAQVDAVSLAMRCSSSALSVMTVRVSK
jgi:hypothetical protein